jgi:putative flippase GtrA
MTLSPRLAIARLLALTRFGIVGLTGLVVNQAALVAFAEAGGLHYLVAAIGATQISTTWNFVGIERWAFAKRSVGRRWLTRYAWFLTVNNLALMLRIPLLWSLVTLIGLHYVVGNVITLVILFLARFAVADGWIWRATEAVPTAKPTSVPEGEEQAASHSYDVAGLVRISSAVELPELAYFRSEAASNPDIRIRITSLGRWPTMRSRFTRDGSRISYVEHLGAVGANFTIKIGEPIEVSVSPLLAKSRHVLYTNVLEALLRFLLVSRGYVLLHSAAVVVDGQAVLLSAQTDTGKTSTVIKLVRQYAYEFLSDDMTIIAPDGRALCYPKPMTLSYHTVAVISGRALRRRQRAALSVQSRLHSKSGRTIGRFLGTLRIPIMSVNSVVQILVPPPKYAIDALVPSRIGTHAPISHAVLMERGEPLRTRLNVSDAADLLIENTDDAYGFPPFATLAPELSIAGMDYAQLRARERELLEEALERVVVWRVRVPGHEWDAALSDILADNSGEISALPVAPDRLVPVPVMVAETQAPYDARKQSDPNRRA